MNLIIQFFFFQLIHQYFIQKKKKTFQFDQHLILNKKKKIEFDSFILQHKKKKMIKSDLFDGIPTISELQALVKEKDEIEKEISQLRNYLNSTKYGIHGSLVDKEGYPIGDTETIIEVRTARHRLAG